MAATKLKVGLAGVIILAASVVTPLLIQHQAQARLREQEEALRQQAAQLARLREENAALSNRAEAARSLSAPPDEHLREVLRLRGEITRLRAEAQKLQPAKTPAPMSRQDLLAAKEEVWGQRLSQLRQWLEANPSERIPELQLLEESDWLEALHPFQLEDPEEYRHVMSTLRNNAALRMEDRLCVALRQYRKQNNGQFPTDLSQLNPYFKSPVDEACLQRWQILPASSLVSELQPGGDWVITQKAPVNAELDMRLAIGLTDLRSAGSDVTNRWTLIH
jgi:type II secretory pathway pseudopilin PulG